VRAARAQRAERSDVRPVLGPVNALMRTVLGLEAPLLAKRNLPFGLSVIGVAEKAQAATRVSAPRACEPRREAAVSARRSSVTA